MMTLLKFRFALGACLILALYSVAGSAWAATDVPRFQDYTVGVYSGQVRAPVLSSHPEARTYRTRLRNAAKGRVNFAGEYILTSWGCGARCLMGAAINARTGRVYFLPRTICCWDIDNENVNPIDYQVDSNLIVFTGLLDEEEPMATHYFEFRGGRFNFIQRQTASSGGANTGLGGASQSVTPTCPPGFILSGSQCARAPTPASSGQFDIRDGYDLPGGDYDKVRGLNNYQQCQDACRRDQRCFGFTYNIRASLCFLKWRGENWTRFQGAVSGLKLANRAEPAGGGSGGGYNAYVVGLGRNDILSMRSDPSQGRNKIGVIPGDAEGIFVHRCDLLGGNNWCEVTYQGQRGWIIGDNLQNVEGG